VKCVSTEAAPFSIRGGAMKSVRLLLLIVLAVFILYVKLSTSGTGGGATSPSASSWVADSQHVPAKAQQVLQYVRENGRAPDGYVGGRVFENREGRLPTDGDYREFDVDPHNGQRNAERIIVEWNTKKAWYTGDHYRTFIPMP
jgi:guanyl-specific ribonuclease Sa